MSLSMQYAEVQVNDTLPTWSQLLRTKFANMVIFVDQFVFSLSKHSKHINIGLLLRILYEALSLINKCNLETTW